MDNMIEVTGIDLEAFAKAVYKLSKSQGLGFLHYQGGALPDEEAKALVSAKYGGDSILSMDYVHGRACKMNVFNIGDKQFIRDSWYDHTDGQFAELLTEFDLPIPQHIKHGTACACGECGAER